MALYTLYPDLNKFAFIGFDEKQIIALCGDDPHDRFDFHSIPKSFEGIVTGGFQDSCRLKLKIMPPHSSHFPG